MGFECLEYPFDYEYLNRKKKIVEKGIRKTKY